MNNRMLTKNRVRNKIVDEYFCDNSVEKNYLVI